MKGIKVTGTKPGIVGVNVTFTLDEVIALKELADNVVRESGERNSTSDERNNSPEVRLASVIAKIHYSVFDIEDVIENMLKCENIFIEQDSEAKAFDDTRKKADEHNAEMH